jgi:predicted GNAT family N-acyltransferase
MTACAADVMTLKHRRTQEAGVYRDSGALAPSRKRDWPRADSSLWPTDALISRDPRVTLLREGDDLSALGRLRYELYIERDLKQYKCADHRNRTLIEPIDALSLNFAASIDGELLAAVRLVRARHALLDPHLRLLVEARQPEDIDQTMVCSRLSVRSEYRARTLIKPMFREAYRIGLSVGARHFLLGTRASLIGVFQRFGFCPTGAMVSDTVANSIHVLDLNVTGPAWLEQDSFTTENAPQAADSSII